MKRYRKISMRILIIGLPGLSLLSFSGTVNEKIISPDRKLACSVVTEKEGMFLSVNMNGKSVIEKSPLTMIVNGTDLTENVRKIKINRFAGDNSYPLYGLHSVAKDWFLSVINGLVARTVKIPLTFLGKGSYETLSLHDDPDNAASATITNSISDSEDTLNVVLVTGGGFMARFSPKKQQ